MRFVPLLCLGLIGISAQAQTLGGRVTSAGEGFMEGVLVSAKQAGSSITVTVVSDDKGMYRFPAGKLPSGRYALSVRAVGFELPPTNAVVREAKPTTANLRLVRTKDLAAQLSNGEWLASVPGTDRQKDVLLNC